MLWHFSWSLHCCGKKVTRIHQQHHWCGVGTLAKSDLDLTNYTYFNSNSIHNNNIHNNIVAPIL